MIIVIGKSGSGKTTVVNELMSLGYRRAVTDTTRPKRPGEVDKVDYNFVSDEEFKTNSQNGAYAEEVVYHASFGTVSYGSRKEIYDQSNEDDVIVLNPYGLKMVNHSVNPENIYSVYLKLDDDLILNRLAKRGDAQEEVVRRLETDRVDFEGMETYCNLTIEVHESDTPSDIANFIDNFYKRFKEEKTN